MNELDVTLGMVARYARRADAWRSATRLKQHEMATDLLGSLRNTTPGIPEELDALALLDALGCAGLSLVIGEYASETFVRIQSEAKS